jgi:ribosomal-protein-alanine N-acetyltransferase
MTEMNLSLPDGRWLGSVTPADAAALVKYLNNPAVTRYTGSIPYPYTLGDAQTWIDERRAWTLTPEPEIFFAIRQAEGELIGTIGLNEFEAGRTRVAEVGYWLAQPFWGQGIMSQAVGAFVLYAFESLGLHRLYARVFDPNVGSWRILEKHGFRLEGVLRHLRRLAARAIPRRPHLWAAQGGVGKSKSPIGS